MMNISSGTDTEQVTVVIPVRNQVSQLATCLEALKRAGADQSNIVVVDDASTDATVETAEAHGVRLVRRPRRGGPAAARNTGVAVTGLADIVIFVDSDVAVAPDAIKRIKTAFRDQSIAAVFGSYDAAPLAAGTVSRYRNLLHHYVHQTSEAEAQTFWAGCGAIRRALFLQLGGFDEADRWNFIEDIEFGNRLSRAGLRIRMDKGLQAKHLKQWTLSTMIRTDILYRSRPWMHLILTTRMIPDDLNVTVNQRTAIALSGFACAGLLLSPLFPYTAIPAMAALASVAVLNIRLLRFFRRVGGIWFAAACFPLHVLHHCCAGIGFLWACGERPLHGIRLLRSSIRPTAAVSRYGGSSGAGARHSRKVGSPSCGGPV
jgi:GT2 family glycosyltransferase